MRYLACNRLFLKHFMMLYCQVLGSMLYFQLLKFLNCSGSSKHSVVKIKNDTEKFSSVQFTHSVMFDSLRPHESQHTRPPCPLPNSGVYSNSCPPSQWCHPTTSSSVVPFSSCPQSLPASGSFPMSQLFAWGGQSTGVSASASVLPMNI